VIWGCAGLGLLAGGALAYQIGRKLSFENYKRAIVICYIVHGGSYVVFSQMRNFGWALVFIALSRTAVGVSSTLNMGQLLRHVADEYRGRVFSTIESMQWSVMMVSMTLAGIASQKYDPRGRRAEFDHGDLLGLGASDGAPAGTGTRRSGAGGSGGTWRTHGVGPILSLSDKLSGDHP
jgi:hypothetical protein